MTIKELEKLDIFHCGYKIHPRRFFVPQVGEQDIPEYYDIQDIFKLIYDKGHTTGTEYGKELKCDEIKNVLNIH